MATVSGMIADYGDPLATPRQPAEPMEPFDPHSSTISSLGKSTKHFEELPTDPRLLQLLQDVSELSEFDEIRKKVEDSGLHFTTEDEFGVSVLHLIARNWELFERFSDLSEIQPLPHEKVCYAAFAHNTDEFMVELAKTGDYVARNGMHLEHYIIVGARYSSQEDSLTEMIQKCRDRKRPFDFDVKDNEGRTPLMYAVLQGHIETLVSLVGASKNEDVLESQFQSCDNTSCSCFDLMWESRSPDEIVLTLTYLKNMQPQLYPYPIRLLSTEPIERPGNINIIDSKAEQLKDRLKEGVLKTLYDLGNDPNAQQEDWEMVSECIYYLSFEEKIDRLPHDERTFHTESSAANNLFLKETDVEIDKQTEVIGSGKFGSVRLGKMKVCTFRRMKFAIALIVAIKIIKLRQEKKPPDEIASEAEKEFNCFAHMIKSPDVVDTYGLIKKGESEYWLVLQHCPNSLRNQLGEIQDKRDQIRLCYQIIRGVRFCSRNNIVQGDPSCGNVLIDRFGNARLCDFGASRGIASYEMVPTIRIGTTYYTPPEKRDFATLENLILADVFSYCYVMEAILNQSEHNFPGDGIFRIRDGVPEALRPILMRGIQRNPADRPNLDELFDSIYHHFQTMCISL